MNQAIKKKAFSLIELSIVILIIGILVAGVTQSSRLVTKMRLQTAQNITNNSPIPSIKDLQLWLETSSERSFNDAEEQDATDITIWYDNNIQSTNKNNALPPAVVNRPKFYENVFNGAIPGIRFDGVNDYLTFDGSSLINNSYTFIVVEQRRSTGNNNFFIGGTAGNFHLGYFNNTTIRVGQYGVAGVNFFDYSVPAYTSPSPIIHTFMHSNVDGKKYWLNGGNTPEASSSNNSPLIAYVPVIGQTENNLFYVGDIAEIIIFSRALKTEERQSIENYLSKKYNIKIS